jgi:hypothetical protein
MKSLLNIAINLLAFGLTSYLAIVQKWSVQELCWSVWLAGLFYSWTCVTTSAIQILLTARTQKEYYDTAVPFIKRISLELFALAIIPVTLLVGWIALYLYCYLFSFYGLFLSVFAEMEPHSLFGRNGFINSDFFTPVTYLAENLWPMILATLIANADDFLQKKPWERILFPFKSNTILRIHIMTIALPFLMMIAWALFKEAYQQLTIVLLIGIFYLLPKKRQKEKAVVSSNSNHTSGEARNGQANEL